MSQGAAVPVIFGDVLVLTATVDGGALGPRRLREGGHLVGSVRAQAPHPYQGKAAAGARADVGGHFDVVVCPRY